MNDEIEQKTERIVSMLERENLDAVLLNAQHNFAWLTGGSSNGVDTSRENGAASLLVTRSGQRFVLANVIEIERMLNEELSDKDFEPIDFSWQGEKANGILIFEKAKFVLGTGATLATDIRMDANTAAIENKIAPCRYQLTTHEADRMRVLGRDAEAAVSRVIKELNPGESEIMIAEQLRHELGLGEMTSVVTLVAADDRIAQYRHPVPTQNLWNKILLLVTCAKRHGLIVSLSRIVCFGDVPDELQQKTEALAYVNANLTAACIPGATGAELYKTAGDAYEKIGFADEINRHHQGGATGYRTREWAAHPQSLETVKTDQAFAWNPSIAGTKIEETCIVSDDGAEIITASADFPQISVTIKGRDYLSPGILSI